MNQPSHYQAAFFKELASREGTTLSVIYARGQTAQRRELGWDDSSLGERGYTEATLPRRFALPGVLMRVWAERRSIHLVNGVWAVRAFVVATLAMVLFRADFFFHSEAPNPAEERGGLFRTLKRSFGRWMARRSRGMFLVGAKGCQYYETMGVSPERIFKFSYFVDGRFRPARMRRTDGVFRICYLGQFVARKRVEDLIEAVARLQRKGLRLRLRLVGAGPARESYEARIRDAGCGDVVSIEGAVAPEKVGEILQDSDVLVLPSGFDGWGLTVNEALHAGVPAIASDGCGSAEILASRPAWGETYPVGEVEALGDSLERISRQPDRYRPFPDEVDRILGCRRMTDYFLDCVNWALIGAGNRAKPQLEW